jgi:inosose dehydratase
VRTRVANAPVSFGAFELTFARSPDVPGPERVLAAIAAAGYEGTELGPPGYLGDAVELPARLAEHGLALTGGYVPLRLGEPGEDLAGLDETLALFDAAGGTPRAVLADDGERGGEVDWPRLLDGLRRAAERVRERGYEPAFHHHMGTRVERPAEIERVLEGTDVPLLLDTGHLLAAGGDPVAVLRAWRDRIDYLHVKDVDLGLLATAPSWGEAWRGGVFCELGTGGVDLAGFFRELGDYDGWLVVEQDWVPRPGEDAETQVEAQARNRAWLAEHAGLRLVSDGA